MRVAGDHRESSSHCAEKAQKRLIEIRQMRQEIRPKLGFGTYIPPHRRDAKQERVAVEKEKASRLEQYRLSFNAYRDQKKAEAEKKRVEEEHKEDSASQQTVALKKNRFETLAALVA